MSEIEATERALLGAELEMAWRTPRTATDRCNVAIVAFGRPDTDLSRRLSAAGRRVVWLERRLGVRGTAA